MKTNTKSLLARITAIILTVAVLLVSIPFAVITASAAGPVADSYVIWEANPDKISMEDNAVVTPSSYWFDWTRQSPDEISDVSYYSTEYSSTTNVKTFFKSGYSNDQAPWLYNGQQLVGKYGKLKFDLRTSTTITVGLGYSNYANAQFAGYLGVATNTVANEWVSHEIDLIDISYDINWWYGYVSVEVSNLGDTIDENNHLFMDIRNMRIEISEKDRAAINDDAAAAERSDLAFDSLIAFDRTYSIYTANKNDVEVNVNGNGTVIADISENVYIGDTVTLTTEGTKNTALSTISAVSASGAEIELTNAGNGTYTFIMPHEEVTVSAEFVKTPYNYNYVIWDANPDNVTLDDNAVVTPSSYWYDWYRFPADSDSDVSYYSTDYASTTNVKTFFQSGCTSNQVSWIYTAQPIVSKYAKLKLELRTSTTATVSFGYANYNAATLVAYMGSATNSVANEWVSHEIDMPDLANVFNWWYGYVAVEVSNLGETIDDNNHLFMDVRNMRIELNESDRAAINADLEAAGIELTFDDLIAYDKASAYSDNSYSTVTANISGGADVAFTGLTDGKAISNSEISFKVTPKTGFVNPQISAIDAKGNTVELTNENGTYYFIMPNSAVTVKVSLTSQGNIFDTYTVFEANPNRVSRTDGGIVSNSNGTMETTRESENGKSYYRVKFTTDGEGNKTFINTGVNNNALEWFGDRATMIALNPFLKFKFDARANKTSGYYVRFFMGANDSSNVYVPCEFATNIQIPTEWTEYEYTNIATSHEYWSGNLVACLWASGTKPSESDPMYLDIRNFRITVDESQRNAIDDALEAAGSTYRFDDIIVGESSFEYSENYPGYQNIYTEEAIIPIDSAKYTGSIGLIGLGKRAKSGETVVIDIEPDNRSTLKNIVVKTITGETVEATKISENQYSITMPDNHITITPIVTDDVSFRATCVNTKGDTQDIRFIATFKHLLSHFAVGLNIKATLEDGTVKEWREFTQNVYETLKNYGDDFTPYSISGNNDGYAYAVTVEGVPTNMGNIAFEVTPFLSDGKDGITNGETETVYYYNGILENTMLKHANNTEDNFDVSFEADHPGVVNMDAKYTLVVKDENGIAVANPTIEVSNSAVTVNDLDITVPYSVRSSDEKLIITISKDGKSTAYWVDFPKFTAAPTFNDDFDSLNTDVWSPFVGDTENTNLITTVTDGDKNVLSMNDTVAGSPPSISSSGNFAQSYGCFSANIRMPTTGNGNAAFWLYSEVAYTFKNADGTIGKALSAYIPNLEDTTGNNSYGEIDVVERSAKWNYGGYATSLHWGGQGDVNGTLTSANKVSAYAYGSDASVYQTYSVVWTDTMICWYLDGELVFKYYPEMPEDGTVDYRNNGMGVGPDSGKMFLILQNTHGTVNGWCGPYDEADFPATMYVDWVQVYGLN